MKLYNSVKITKGKNGFGGPLILSPNETKNKIVSITGGGIDPLAEHIANFTNCEAIDGFTTTVSDEEILCVVIDCGGTARCGVYPRKNIPTINITPVGATGPLAKYILPEIYVSDVKLQNVERAEELKQAKNKNFISSKNIAETSFVNKNENENKNEKPKEVRSKNEKENVLVYIGKKMGGFVGIMFNSGRDAIDMVIKNILPFMAFVSMMIGIIKGTGLGDLIATTISPFAGTLPGLIAISMICGIPFISPIIGPGAVIAQVVGVLIGEQIARGSIHPSFALPALFAIDAQIGADFIPVGLSLGEAEQNTITAGVPAILFSRLITAPIAVIIAYVFSIGMY